MMVTVTLDRKTGQVIKTMIEKADEKIDYLELVNILSEKIYLNVSEIIKPL